MPFEVPPRKKPSGDNGYLEELTRAVFQAGFSWQVIEDKWPSFRRAFDQFDVATVAGYGEPDVERLARDKGIVRNHRKIVATIHNAGEIWDLSQSYGSFHAYLRSLDGVSYAARRKELSQRFKNLGPTSVFVFLWRVDEDVPDWEDRNK